MPATPIYALPYPAAADPADVPLDLQRLAERVALILGGALSATPPATPFEGQLWAMSPVAGVVWVFRYNAASASAFKWEFVGGPPMLANVETNQTTTSTAYVDLATVGPSLTAPRAGEYHIEHGANLYANAFENAWATVKLGAAAAADADGSYATVTAANVAVDTARRLLRTLAANDLVKQQYKEVTGGTTTNVRNRWLKLAPVRVS